MIEVNTVKTDIPIPRSALPSDCDISNLAAAINLSDATNTIDMSKLLKVTVPSGRVSSNYIFVNTGNTFYNMPNNEPAFYFLTIFDKSSLNKILYSVPIRWCGRVNGTGAITENTVDVYQNLPKPNPIKYFEV